MSRVRLGGAALLGTLLSATVAAHDFWIEPSSFRPAVGSDVAARLMVGQKFRGEALPRNPALIVKFVLASDRGETPVSGRAGAEPAGRVSITEPGLLVLGYRSRNSPLSLEAAKFEEYLREEGLESIIAARALLGESQKPSREVFSRCAKALVSAGEGGGSGYDRSLGLSLELIPEKNPYAMKAGEELPVRLLFEGKPLRGALVAALPYAAPEEKVSQRTDREGRVRLRLPREGAWLVKAVHMAPAPADTGADWQSLWASLTFEIPAGSPVGKAP
jgi:uncharacterized GH25 family protein